MRNLKKTLCLVLALVFVLGLCTVGAADVKDYSDVDEITAQYYNAVKALSGLGILEGDDNDSDGVKDFRPSDTVTRAQAAKIIAYIMLGTDAEKWPTKQVFDDVAETSWAARYIAYCEYKGVINGYGNGKFGPNDPVTKMQLCKMLLAACGYGGNNEFVGKDWDRAVFERAMTTKIIKNLLDVDMDAPATREETAFLGYNTMMNVNQVVFNTSSNKYDTTASDFAAETWDLDSVSGVVVSNKATVQKGLGTALIGQTGVYVTDKDTDASIIGHFVTIKFRDENGQNIAYYVDDECTEVGGAAAKDAAIASKYAFADGTQNDTIFPATIAATTPGTFVLNGLGQIVAYKTESYIIASLKADAKGALYVSYPAIGDVYPTTPEGAKKDDIVTVFKSGNVYRAEATTSAQVKITESKATAGVYAYNGGAVHAAFADSVEASLKYTALNGTSQLAVGTTYVIFYDSTGASFGFAAVPGPAAAANEYVYFITQDQTAGEYGAATYYAQIIDATGAKQKVVTDALYGTTAYLAAITTNTAGQKVLTKVTGAVAGEVGVDTYGNLAKDPRVDLSKATFINYSGAGATLKVSLQGKPTATTTVQYTFTEEKNGTTTIQKVKTIWFSSSNVASETATATSDYIYVTKSDVDHVALVGDKAMNYFAGYKNGAAVSDLYFLSTGTGAVSSLTVGFNSVQVNPATAGYPYTLTPVSALGAKAAGTGVRTLTVSKTSTDVYFANGKLYVDTDVALDLTDIKVVKLTKAEPTLSLASTDDIIAAVLAGKTITFTFVETYGATGGKIVSGALYVTAIA